MVFLTLGAGKVLFWPLLTNLDLDIWGGVEISTQLAEISKQNFKRLGIGGVELYCDDARNIKNLDSYNYFYFSNPFPHSVFAVVMENIVNSYKKRNRKIVIIYDNPVCKEDVLRSGLFVLKQTIQKHWYNMMWCDVCIFETP